MRRLRELGVPAYICHALEKDPTILAEQPKGTAEPIVWRRRNGVRLADWLVAALRKRGYEVNPTPSEYA
jgi:hypothetical protein